MKKQSGFENKKRSGLKTTAQIFALGAVIIAANASNAQLCARNIATTTTYFVPHIKDYCSTPTPCAAFKKEVRMQGSGTLSGGRILTYTGKIVKMDNCDTAIGASGKCLIPFISVAADPRHYSMGDIIQMPSLKGKIITLPNGKTMRHPGYFIVHDTGGAIRGSNRFDIFTGGFEMNNDHNAFGTLGSPDMQMVDARDCASRKQFEVVRRSAPNYENALVAIEDAVSEAVEQSKVMYASVEPTAVRAGIQ
ncbi:3D domain-containing protein [Bdellovibrio sp. ArHS]|uniref:3D domain-containing protein n=1 Tax=Bdellovibrio sp. ArHS TaxID=1569284 RepID=UPI000AF739A8|nr:3D domain-containing protein [Bdellovibrio sp. ArHS]